MKKFLAILLIAIVACSTVSVVDEGKLPEDVKNALSTVLKTLKKVVQFLKNSGYLDPVVKFLKSTGLVVPKELCLKVFDEESCDELFGSLLQKSEDGELVLNSKIRIALKVIKYAFDALGLLEIYEEAKEWVKKKLE